jgi:hypothetical protein
VLRRHRRRRLRAPAHHDRRASPKDLPEFKWVNTILGNLKTSLGGTHHAFDFAKYGTRYLAAFAYRFNRRFRLDLLQARLLAAAVCTGPRPEQWLRSAEASC